MPPVLLSARPGDTIYICPSSDMSGTSGYSGDKRYILTLNDGSKINFLSVVYELTLEWLEILKRPVNHNELANTLYLRTTINCPSSAKFVIYVNLINNEINWQSYNRASGLVYSGAGAETQITYKNLPNFQIILNIPVRIIFPSYLPVYKLEILHEIGHMFSLCDQYGEAGASTIAHHQLCDTILRSEKPAKSIMAGAVVHYTPNSEDDHLSSLEILEPSSQVITEHDRLFVRLLSCAAESEASWLSDELVTAFHRPIYSSEYYSIDQSKETKRETFQEALEALKRRGAKIHESCNRTPPKLQPVIFSGSIAQSGDSIYYREYIPEKGRLLDSLYPSTPELCAHKCDETANCSGLFLESRSKGLKCLLYTNYLGQSSNAIAVFYKRTFIFDRKSKFVDTSNFKIQSGVSNLLECLDLCKADDFCISFQVEYNFEAQKPYTCRFRKKIDLVRQIPALDDDPNITGIFTKVP